jgi:hypothetical protein
MSVTKLVTDDDYLAFIMCVRLGSSLLQVERTFCMVTDREAAIAVGHDATVPVHVIILSRCIRRREQILCWKDADWLRGRMLLK